MSRAAAWKRQSDHDFQHAQTSLARGEWDWACYAAMQAAEKALKAGLLATGSAEIWGHNLSALLARLAEIAGLETPVALMNGAKLLSQYNVLARYPMGDMDAAPVDLLLEDQAMTAIAAATALREWVRENIDDA